MKNFWGRVIMNLFIDLVSCIYSNTYHTCTILVLVIIWLFSGSFFFFVETFFQILVNAFMRNEFDNFNEKWEKVWPTVLWTQILCHVTTYRMCKQQGTAIAIYTTQTHSLSCLAYSDSLLDKLSLITLPHLNLTKMFKESEKQKVMKLKVKLLLNSKISKY